MADELTRHVEHMIAVTEELKKVIIAFRSLPVPAVTSPEEAAIRHQLELALFRVHVGLITAPTVTAAMLRPMIH